MERREIQLSSKVPSQEEIDLHVRRAHELRSEMLAHAVRAVVVRASRALRVLLGGSRRERQRTDELRVRYLRAASPAHVAPGSPSDGARPASRTPSEGDRARAA